MSISKQARTQITGLIREGESVDPLDLEAFCRWMDSSYETLKFDPVQQKRFDKYCRSLSGHTPMRLYLGTWMLKQFLYRQSLEELTYERCDLPMEGMPYL